MQDPHEAGPHNEEEEDGIARNGQHNIQCYESFCCIDQSNAQS
jgi:hypothetical protein